MNHKKGNNFGWFFGGRHYDFFASILGFGKEYYREIAKILPLKKDISVLDLGCGTGSVGFAISRRLEGNVDMHGIDLSGTQLNYAALKAEKENMDLSLYRGSMDLLPFKDESFDLVIISVAFCETTAQVRKDVIKEVSRVLKKNSFFAIVDCAKPRIGIETVMMLPFFMFKQTAEGWNNYYPDMCSENNMILENEIYIKSYVKYQLFRKAD